MFSGELAKLAITFAHVDRFYCNVVICLRLDVVLLGQTHTNSRCLPFCDDFFGSVNGLVSMTTSASLSVEAISRKKLLHYLAGTDY